MFACCCTCTKSYVFKQELNIFPRPFQILAHQQCFFMLAALFCLAKCPPVQFSSEPSTPVRLACVCVCIFFFYHKQVIFFLCNWGSWPKKEMYIEGLGGLLAKAIICAAHRSNAADNSSRVFPGDAEPHYPSFHPSQLRCHFSDQGPSQSGPMEAQGLMRPPASH